MALDSTVGGANADSYASLAEFKAYADAIGFTYTSVYTDDVIEIAMRKATQYLDRAYRGKWKGFRSDRDQALAWPRMSTQNLPVNYLTPSFTTGVIDEDGYEIPSNTIPKQVKEAEYEATIISLGGSDLLPPYPRGNAIKRKKVKAGPVETETEYMDSASARDRYLKIEGLLYGLTTGQPGATSGSGKLVRA
ncbi:DnaT-like ssDNA-binding protein [Rhizobium sp. NLR22b]|uniref:DnaT-like ssDNA-binding protein n=1 Tax=Rhizobium sp. NLR22b TaxID=2731115 RepID=UPI001C836681|nr:DnaT-like ssDNA-binding protein [Rhizobium sp. NLR22b]MBX5238628.1 hypothetical protein [Rhizobium sp. NLR22b]